jgi:AraC-like DNA-binding protein
MASALASNALDEWTGFTPPSPDGAVALAPIFRSPLLEVVHWRCLRDAGSLKRERRQLWAMLTLAEAGASVVHRSLGTTLVEPACAVLHEPLAPYRTTHPFGCGDEGCSVLLSPAITQELGARRGALGSAPSERAWPVGTAVVPARPRLELFLLARRVRRGLPVAPLAVEEAVMALVAGLLDGLPVRRAGKRAPARDTTRASHRALVESVRAYFVGHLDQRIQLAQVAAAAGVSPFHLARTFRRATGTTLHRYLTRLRLVWALPRATEPRASLTELALDLGFSSHSHLTAAFHREFGVPPSEARRRTTAREED